MAEQDKVEFLKKNGPLPQYGQGVKVKDNGNVVELTDAFKIQAKGAPGTPPKKR